VNKLAACKIDEHYKCEHEHTCGYDADAAVPRVKLLVVRLRDLLYVLQTEVVLPELDDILVAERPVAVVAHGVCRPPRMPLAELAIHIIGPRACCRLFHGLLCL